MNIRDRRRELRAIREAQRAMGKNMQHAGLWVGVANAFAIYAIVIGFGLVCYGLFRLFL